MEVVIIGTGNVADVLGRKISRCGHHIIEVAGRNAVHAQNLASLLNSRAISSFSDISRSADIYIIAVADQALHTISNWLPPVREGVVVHTAGAVSQQVLQGVAEHYGVLYPLQSLKSGYPVSTGIPFLIDADSPGTLSVIQSFSASLSSRVQFADDAMRLKLHTAAVVANNFTNFLYTLTQEFCVSEKLDFSLLLPLLQETVKRLEQQPAALMQTGPAIRRDEETMAKHRSVLASYPALDEIYREFSAGIAGYYEPVDKNT